MDPMMTWLSPKRLMPAEKAWIFFYFLVLAALTTAPYVFFRAATPANEHYTWASSFYYDDYFQYYSWARQIAEGDLLIRNQYTSNPEASFALFNPYFLAMGWLTKITGNVYFAYHFLRIAGIALFSYVIYAFVAIFLRRIRPRRAATLLILAGGLEFPFYFLTGRPATPLADPYIYKILYRYGHLTFCLSLLLIVVGFYSSYLLQTRELNPHMPFSAFKRTAAKRAITPSVSLMILGLINPYYLILVSALVTTHALLWSIPKRRMDPLLFGIPLLAGAALPVAQYAIQSFSRHTSAITFDDPIYPLNFTLFFCLLLPWAAAGVYVWMRSEHEHNMEAQESAYHDDSAARMLPENLKAPLNFLICWVVVVAILVLTPLPFRARMTFGMQVPLAILAAVWFARGRLLSLARIPLYALLLVDLVFTVQKEIIDFDQNGIGKLDKSLVAALKFLNAEANRGDVIVTTVDVGMVLPAYVAANVYAGHSFQTDHFYEKEAEVKKLFLELSPKEATAWVEERGAEFVLWPPEMRARNPKFEIGWPVVYDKNHFVIYERPGAGGAETESGAKTGEAAGAAEK